jgi:multicomponent Na+:H+ antiporter subunit A
MLGSGALLLVLLAAPVTALVGLLRPRWGTLAGAACCLGSASLFALTWAEGGAVLADLPWLPAPLGARFTLAVDALSAPYAVLTPALAALIAVYVAGYLPGHLQHKGRPLAEERRFSTLLLAFAGAMTLLVLSQDLLLLFLALDLTALLSFFLIRFDAPERGPRRSALVALLVTAGSSPLFVVGAVLVLAEHGTLSVDTLAAAKATAGPLAAALLVGGVLAKSAQFPLHFWLPRAMVAPTPVSAFLHSAAMVAAGVIVVQRLHFLLTPHALLLEAMLWIGFSSILVGSFIALLQDKMKGILAGSTIAQYGHVMVMLGAGDEAGTAGAPVYVVAHGLAKAALFLTAGAVTHVTGKYNLSEVSGLWRRLPVLAAASFVAAASLAGLPFTMGFFKDELFFESAWHAHPAFGVAAALAAAMTLAYSARLWMGIFLGPPSPVSLQPGRTPPLLLAPIAVLGVASVVLGLLPSLSNALMQSAGALVRRGEVAAYLSYSFAARPPTFLAFGAWAGGVTLLVLRRFVSPRFASPLARARISTSRIGAEAIGLALQRLSDFAHRIEVRDMRDRVGFMLLPTAALLLFAALKTTDAFALSPGPFALADAPAALALVTAAFASIAAVMRRSHFGVVLLLSLIGFALALVYATSAAPDVALVSVLVETLLTLLFLTVLSQVPEAELERARGRSSSLAHRHLAVAIVSGIGALFVSWAALMHISRDGVARQYLLLAEAAHAKDVVTAILADFRGLDTVVEMTVLLVAALGVAALSRASRHRAGRS